MAIVPQSFEEIQRVANTILASGVAPTALIPKAKDGEDPQITKDHSFVQSLVDEGRNTADEAIGHPQRSLVTRVLTGDPDDEPDVTVREGRIGDRYLIASDGLTDYVAADTVADVLRAGESPGRTADRLVELALKAGAPDNVTVVIGDVVDASRGASLPTQGQVVGAAAARSPGTRPIPQTPAGKAAALAREAAGNDDPDDEVTLAEEGPAGPGRWLRRIAVLVVALVVIAGGSYAAYAWTQRQWFVGTNDGRVAVFQGVSQDIGPVSLSHVEQQSDVAVTDLPDFYRAKVEDTVSTDTLADAEALVSQLRTEASRCAVARATGGQCADEGDTTTPSTPSTTSTTSSTTTGSTPSSSTSAS
jgi:protein phosphatase